MWCTRPYVGIMHWGEFHPARRHVTLLCWIAVTEPGESSPWHTSARNLKMEKYPCVLSTSPSRQTNKTRLLINQGDGPPFLFAEEEIIKGLTLSNLAQEEPFGLFTMLCGLYIVLWWLELSCTLKCLCSPPSSSQWVGVKCTCRFTVFRELLSVLV